MSQRPFQKHSPASLFYSSCDEGTATEGCKVSRLYPLFVSCILILVPAGSLIILYNRLAPYVTTTVSETQSRLPFLLIRRENCNRRMLTIAHQTPRMYSQTYSLLPLPYVSCAFTNKAFCVFTTMAFVVIGLGVVIGLYGACDIGWPSLLWCHCFL
jgi:hypothetical protein